MKKTIACICISLCLAAVSAQEKIMIDRIVAIVGNKMVKHSEIEAQISNMRMQGEEVSPNAYCEVLERTMISKLYQNQAELDSVEIPDSEVDANLDRRIRYFVAQIGSREKLEEFYNKPIFAIKEEFREMIRSQMITERMETKITEDIRVTPNDVTLFFKKMPTDSQPLVPTTYEVQQIIRIPEVSRAEKDAVKNRLNDLRNRVLKGERFSTLASFYSDDPGSARKGGELGLFDRGTMYPEFESMAFSLKDGEVSPIIETKAGFHIMQLIERKGDQVNVRHILLMPKADIVALDQARKLLDSVSTLIRDTVWSFTEAAARFGNDGSGRTGGYYTSPYSGNIQVTGEEMDPTLFFLIDKFTIGQVSKPAEMETEDREKAMRLVKLTARTEPHRINLEQDYDKILIMAQAKAREEKMHDWLIKKIGNTYIQLLGPANSCTYKYDWRK